jgi:hypothetical protein
VLDSGIENCIERTVDYLIIRIMIGNYVKWNGMFRLASFSAYQPINYSK